MREDLLVDHFVAEMADEEVDLVEQLEPGVAVVGGEQLDEAGDDGADVLVAVKVLAKLEHGSW